jgi:uncharacterized membrane protein YeaQ/YmgE (transglycosylase-associated protein family)
MLIYILALIIGGFVVGALARFALPGPDPMTWWQTILLGIGGAVVGGLIFGLLIGHSIGFVGAFIGAVILLALYRKYVQRRPVFRA